MKDMETYAKGLLQVSPRPSGFRIGDKVTFTNENGVVFEGHQVIGFTEDEFNGRLVHIDTDCYWMPKTPKSLKHADGCPSVCDNCKCNLMDGEVFRHRQEMKTYRVPLNESICLCNGCQEMKRACDERVEDAEAPYVEY